MVFEPPPLSAPEQEATTLRQASFSSVSTTLGVVTNRAEHRALNRTAAGPDDPPVRQESTSHLGACTQYPRFRRDIAVVVRFRYDTEVPSCPRHVHPATQAIQMRRR